MRSSLTHPALPRLPALCCAAALLIAATAHAADGAGKAPPRPHPYEATMLAMSQMPTSVERDSRSVREAPLTRASMAPTQESLSEALRLKRQMHRIAVGE